METRIINLYNHIRESVRADYDESNHGKKLILIVFLKERVYKEKVAKVPEAVQTFSFVFASCYSRAYSIMINS